MPRPSTAKKQTNGGANLGFEQTLWAAADKLRSQEINPTTCRLLLDKPWCTLVWTTPP